ncbi:glucosyltransferase domain-containing protein [Gardnerella vaginalis]
MNQTESSGIKTLNTNQLNDSAALAKNVRKRSVSNTIGVVAEKTYSFKDFIDFCKSNVAELAISAIFLIIAYGQKAFSNTFSIDTEEIISRSKALYNSWIRLERFGLLAFKYVTGRYWYNNSLAGILMILALFASATTWAYLFSKAHNLGAKFHPALFMIPFISAPILAEMLGFLLMGDDVACALMFVSISLMCAHNAYQNRKELKTLLAYALMALIFAIFDFTIYLAMTTVFVAGTAMIALIIKGDYACKFKNIVSYIFTYICVFIASYVCYVILNKIVIATNHTFTDPYIKEQMRWGKDPIAKIIHTIFLHAQNMYLGRTIFHSVFITIALIALVLLTIVQVIRKELNAFTIIFAIAIVASPMMMSVILGTAGTARTELTYPLAGAFSCMYLLHYIMQFSKKTLTTIIACILLAIIGLSQSFTVNRLYYTEYMTYNQDYYIAQDVARRIEVLQANHKNPLKVIFVGNHIADYNPSEFKSNQLELIGRSMFEIGFSTLHGTWVKTGFIRSTTGFKMKNPVLESVYINAEKAAQNLPSWPSDKCTTVLDNKYIVVKFSEPMQNKH